VLSSILYLIYTFSAWYSWQMPTVALYNNRALTFQTLAKKIIFDPVALLMKERISHCVGICQLYHAEKVYIIRWWYPPNTFSWMFLVLAHWSNSPQEGMAFHSDTLSRFLANQYVLFLIIYNANVYLVGALISNILISRRLTYIFGHYRNI
jgi:hypothetical protein